MFFRHTVLGDFSSNVLKLCLWCVRYKLYRTDNPQDLKKDFYSYAGVHGRRSSYVTEVLRSNDASMLAPLKKLPNLPSEQLVDCYDDTGRNVVHFLANHGEQYNHWIPSLTALGEGFFALAMASDVSGQRPFQIAMATGNKVLLDVLRAIPIVVLTEFFFATSGPTKWKQKANWLNASAFPNWFGHHIEALGLAENGLAGVCLFYSV